MNKIDSPCIHCGTRSFGCHGVCPKYEKYQKDLKEQKSRISKARRSEAIIYPESQIKKMRGLKK